MSDYTSMNLFAARRSSVRRWAGGRKPVDCGLEIPGSSGEVPHPRGSRQKLRPKHKGRLPNRGKRPDFRFEET